MISRTVRLSEKDNAKLIKSAELLEVKIAEANRKAIRLQYERLKKKIN